MNNYFNWDYEELYKELQTNKEGISDSQRSQRLIDYGKNTLIENKKKSIPRIFFEQFLDVLVLILILAAIVSFFIGNGESTLVILVVILLNALLGTLQHLKARQSLESLKRLSAPYAKVLKNGVVTELPASEVVIGDVLILEAGDVVAADGRVIESFSLQVNESSLTGESESVTKIEQVLEEKKLPLGDQKNMVFSGSLVTYGRGKVIVTATGMQTELGKIADLMNTTQEKKTPLQVSLDDFSKKLAVVILMICGVIFLLSLYRQMPLLDSLMFAVALAVAAIPEALSSIVTIVLALGTQRMVKENAIIKELKAVESLGSVSIICSDKTGTLTQNKMTVKEIYCNNRFQKSKEMSFKTSVENYLMKAAVLCNDSLTLEEKQIGDPTEIALVNWAENYGVDEVELRKEIQRIAELPFESDRKLMTTLHQVEDKNILFTKGAPDVLLERLAFSETEEGIKPISNEEKERIKKANEEFSARGLRVLGFAYKERREKGELSLVEEKDYTFLGLIAMMDPPREESKQAVEDCLKAGIKPIMITGDHKVTASSIAKELGILKEGDEAIDGRTLNEMTDEELDSKLDKISVYARVSPEHKIRIVSRWQQKGHIVAMTGDGVNDAPALKKADIGIAMGITGTQVSKDAAAIILTDDNFATIIKAVSNGRNVYRNIQNAIHFLLSGNTAGILTVLYTSLMALPIPFAAVQLLFINLVTDSLPAIAIGVEKGNHMVLNTKPRNAKENILNKKLLKAIFIEGGLFTICTLLAFYSGLKAGGAQVASTMAFATLCLARLFHGFNCRGEESLVKLGLFTNVFSILAFILGVALLNAVLFIPACQQLFNISPLTIEQIATFSLLAFLPTCIIQLIKGIKSL
ncbi:calcium-translocating P-type ATPase, PMCA-type [Sporanaerobium hydrogeniformans]|uniref:Calcium-translocating P-type ATPase, PMCA-type n=1 Tax=Sporanaerobium hydrogeniformans TaxID=3072179 RepID=A0AC61D9L4_9FIRM|nr:calcium-translocating P-type ATPase, PMCA-type [Sporanaerobium hydrogeniformans]PHV69959.1 calcium-translocating P-type ATPase, PMCA-type [Sporanaerobium hydrogeniformans]